MGYKADKEKRNIRDHNMQYLGLTEFEIILHEAIMQMPVNINPESLTEHIKKTSQEVGYCGDVHAVCVVEWLKEKLR